MPPFGFTPPARGGRAMPLPRGGRAVPVKAPRAPGVSVRVKPIDPNAQAQQNAMSAFRTALAQLQSSTPAVDQNAIYAPYRSSEAVTGQLGQGLQQSLLNSGQAAQSQYGAALDQAQQHAAQFGISAGAGANPTALQNNGAAPLAQQTNAYAAAAPQAATAWQQALERAAAAKVSDATLAREQGLTTAKQALSTALPSAIQNEKDFAFKTRAQRFDEGLALSQLGLKKAADVRKYALGAAKVSTSASSAATRAAQNATSIAERARHDRATEKVAQAKLQQGQVKLTVAQQKAAKGLTGVASAIKALTPSTSKSGTTRVARGFDADLVSWDGTTAGTHIQRGIHVPRADKPPAGYKFVGTPVAHYDSAPSSSVTSGVTAGQWDAQYRSLLGQNPGKGAQIRAVLGPRPKKK